MNIATVDARPLFTKSLVDVYLERTKPTEFLRSFFPKTESLTKEISIEVERGFKKVAVDVERGTDGNRNSWSKSTEKIFVPPYYREYFEVTELALYDALFGHSEISSEMFAAFVDSAADRLGGLQDKIDRAYEIQCSQVMQTGIVTLNAGVNIDFKRKADSLVDAGAGYYWEDANVDPNTILESGCKFLREVGKSTGAVVNAIFGSEALTKFLANTAVQNRGKIFNYALDIITPAQRDSTGASCHGEVSVGSYRVRIWTYPQVYTNAAGATVDYIDSKTIILLPEVPRFKLSFAAVPQLISDGPVPKKGAYLVEEFIDRRKKSHVIDIQSAGVAIPVAVDQIYTAKVVAG